MRIKKHGKTFTGVKDLPKFEKFRCEKCGCEFNCEEDEYYADLGGADPLWAPTTSGSSTGYYYQIRTTVKDYLVCSCPECHKIVKKIKERNTSDWTSSTTFTLNNIKTVTDSIPDAKFDDNTAIDITCGSYKADLAKE